LTPAAGDLELSSFFFTSFTRYHSPMTPVRRYRETIGGRVYHIEASPVRDDRWRAQIARVPGMPTALMPFYGTTADEAAQQLCEWLARAHRTCGAA